MITRYDVRITLASQLKKCPNGHKVGDTWLVERKTPGGMCMGAFCSLVPYLTALRFGASFPWEDREGTITIGCPDHVNQVVWRLDRLEAESAPAVKDQGQGHQS